MRTKASPQNIDRQIKQRMRRMADLAERIDELCSRAIYAERESDFFAVLNEMRKLAAVAQRENAPRVTAMLSSLSGELSEHYRSVERPEPYGQLVIDQLGRRKIVGRYLPELKQRIGEIVHSLALVYSDRGNPIVGAVGKLSIALRYLADARVLYQTLLRNQGQRQAVMLRIVRNIDKAYAILLQNNRYWESTGLIDWKDTLAITRSALTVAASVNSQIINSRGKELENERIVRLLKDALWSSYGKLYTFVRVAERQQRDA